MKREKLRQQGSTSQQLVQKLAGIIQIPKDTSSPVNITIGNINIINNSEQFSISTNSPPKRKGKSFLEWFKLLKNSKLLRWLGVILGLFISTPTM